MYLYQKTDKGSPGVSTVIRDSRAGKTCNLGHGDDFWSLVVQSPTLGAYERTQQEAHLPVQTYQKGGPISPSKGWWETNSRLNYYNIQKTLSHRRLLVTSYLEAVS